MITLNAGDVREIARLIDALESFEFGGTYPTVGSEIVLCNNMGYKLGKLVFNRDHESWDYVPEEGYGNEA